MRRSTRLTDVGRINIINHRHVGSARSRRASAAHGCDSTDPLLANKKRIMIYKLSNRCINCALLSVMAEDNMFKPSSGRLVHSRERLAHRDEDMTETVARQWRPFVGSSSRGASDPKPVACNNLAITKHCSTRRYSSLPLHYRSDCILVPIGRANRPELVQLPIERKFSPYSHENIV